MYLKVNAIGKFQNKSTNDWRQRDLMQEKRHEELKMTDELARRLIDTVIYVTEKYWGHSLLDICADMTGNDKLTSEELVKYLSPITMSLLEHELMKKYINRPYLEKLIAQYETFLNINKKARGSASEPL